MVILGAKGHAKEIIDILEKNNFQEEIMLFDNISKDLPDYVFDKFKVIRSFETLNDAFVNDPKFVIGVGNPRVRRSLCEKALNLGGKLCSAISNTAFIGSYEVEIGIGANIMFDVRITNSVKIGIGCLINSKTLIHHDVEIGDYCEICPGSCITGGVKIGNFCSIGSGAIILPEVKLGNHSIVGAGSVVTKDFGDNKKIIGTPAKIVNNRS